MKHSIFYFNKPKPYAVLYRGELLEAHGNDVAEDHDVRITSLHVNATEFECDTIPVDNLDELDFIMLSDFKQLNEDNDNYVDT